MPLWGVILGGNSEPVVAGFFLYSSVILKLLKILEAITIILRIHGHGFCEYEVHPVLFGANGMFTIPFNDTRNIL
jgi:hypothetical protein